MIKITNGLNTLEVTPGAFKDIFSAQGYTPVQEMPIEQTGVSVEQPQPSEVKLPEATPESTTASISEQETDLPTPEETSEEENLSEIPISEMTNKQLKEYAEQLGVNIEGITSRKAVMNKIRSAL